MVSHSPCLVPNNSGNGVTGYSIVSRYFLSNCCIGREYRAYLANNLPCQFCLWVFFSGQASAFCHHVFHVLLLWSQEQMFGVAARRVIAGVTHVHAGGYGAVCKFISHPMAVSLPPRNLGVPIAGLFDDGSGPYPAIIGTATANLKPEITDHFCQKVWRLIVFAVAHFASPDKRLGQSDRGFTRAAFARHLYAGSWRAANAG